jgi:transcription-repair coupling factor (superfamily II helicase)
MATVSPHAKVAEQLVQLPNILTDNEDFQKALAALAEGKAVSFDEVWGSSCALLTAAIAKRFENVLVIVKDLKVQDDLCDDLSTFHSAEVGRFAAMTLSPGANITVDQEYGDRLRMLKDLITGNTMPIMVASIQGLLQPVPSKDAIVEYSKTIRSGETLNVKAFSDWLTENGFHQTSAVELPSEFSSRGGIVDVFAPDWLQPIRIELFDDEIESLRQFEIRNQRSTAELAEVEITVLAPSFDSNVHLAEFLSDNTAVIQVEPAEIAEQARQYLERSAIAKDLFSWNQVTQSLAQNPMATANRISAGRLDEHFSVAAETIEDFSGDIGELRLELDRVGEDSEVYVVARVEGEVQRVQEILSTTKTASSGRLNFSVGCVHAGFRIRSHKTVLIGCDQLFHRGELRRSRSRRQLGKTIDSFLSLREGDLIVHLSHGIGRFRGLKMLDKDGQRAEHLELEFYGGTRIYVPATKIDLVQKYIGGSKTRPTLARIGGKSWIKQKKAAEEAASDLASDMLELQAARASRPGIAFKADTQWQYEFEQSFPYRETPDQLTAIQAIKGDMQTARPMDRLLCGDVGFGKTEVAMRAAFKAVENGYQVGLLAPTTVLVEQHHKSFKARMSEFPLDIGKLSRFCSTREIRETIEKLKKGQVDIVIGTHRLVSKDVKFFNLGLVIIDEEQRFGVAHKERLKTLRESVDILTMSATPIPRTLHMSLVGVRDISNLETPPEERRPVETRVTRFADETIRFAIHRELNRGGQTYFVHNRVNDIHIVRDRIQRIVPEASICVGHGQMPEDELSQVMTDFIAGKFDILLATTIIESGLDIPNANTIFIDEADRYGLADLHQLRGRVGRYKHKAYCYLLLEPGKHVTPVAAKRLQAIETFSEMGAGFSISMRDLEIRGAGNLLGTEQSGHIAAIGYELYCQLLENAVREIKKLPAKIAIDVDIDLPIAAHLPDEYITDRRQKIDFYRRMTRIDDFEQIKELRAEMKDRFGPIPRPAERMLQLARLKLEAAIWQIESVFLEDTYLGFRFSNRQRFEMLANQKKGILRIVDDKTAYITLKSTKISPPKMLALVKSILQAKS